MEKMKIKNLTVFFLLSAFLGASTASWAADSFLPDSQRSLQQFDEKSIKDLQDSVLRTTRLLQHKQEMETLAENNPDTRPVDPQIIFLSQPMDSILLGSESADINTFLTGLQAQSPLGLFESYPQDGNLNQGFTYDQALAGIALLKSNRDADAKKVFDFYKAQWDGTGFWTVYNTQNANGFKIEYHKINGPNAWIALFALTYYRQTGDASALDLATNIGKWIAGLPHQDGGVAMGTNNPAGNPNWGTIYSIENNLDDYAIFSLLSKKAVSSADRAFFKEQKDALALFLKNKAFDTNVGLFKRGPSNSINDNTLSLDTNSWAFSVLGVDGLKDLLGYNDQDIANFVSRIETTFAVQSNGTFGGNILTAKGFDFAYSQNAVMAGRQGIVWVEGTNQMALVYRQLADYYQTSDVTRSASYQLRADHFLALNANYLSSDGKSYVYADQANVRVFWDVGGWNTAPGSAVPSTMWVYYAVNNINPFAPYVVKNLSAPVHFASSSQNSSANFQFDMDVNFQVSLTYQNRFYSGYFDTDLMQINFTTSPIETGFLTENLKLTFDEFRVGSNWGYSINSFDRLLGRVDASVYDYNYKYYQDGSLRTEALNQLVNGHSNLWSADYTYLTVNGISKIDTQVVSTTFDNFYGYGTSMDYEYDISGRTTRVTVTQETRNNPLFRILESYAYIFNVDGTVDLVSLGKQVLL